MTDQQDTPKSTDGTKGVRPSHSAWLVIDSPTGDKPIWKELTGLWPTRTGDGLSGSVNTPLTLADGLLLGRLVILPVRPRPDDQGDDAEQGNDATA